MPKNEGIAVDLDDTLADTFRHFIGEVQNRFGNPENLAIGEIIVKYKIMPNISYWQTPEVKTWLDEQSRSNEAQERIGVMKGALETIQKIHAIMPVKMYITSRPESVLEGTKLWLKKNGFPEAEVIVRPNSMIKIDGNSWKAKILIDRFPEIVGIIDDNPEIIRFLNRHYSGAVYLFGADTNPYSSDIRVMPCKTWPDVLTAMMSEIK